MDIVATKGAEIAKGNAMGNFIIIAAIVLFLLTIVVNISHSQGKLVVVDEGL